MRDERPPARLAYNHRMAAVCRWLLPLLLSVLAAFPDRAYVEAQAEPQSASQAVTHPALPLQFDSEIVRLFVEEDSLEVEGIYHFLCRSRRDAIVTLVYPYPVDSLLGGARSTLLECRAPGGPWQPMEFKELPQRPGVRWGIPLGLGDTLEVRTVYRQALLSTYARYILTTTKSWGRPLKHARFEIHLPDGAEPLRFSYPFECQEVLGESLYLYEVENFMPERDIIVEWRP
jgi:hypothetical protein